MGAVIRAVGLSHVYSEGTPFEKTAMLNQKAVLFRVHKSLSQIPDTLKEKAVSIAADSVEFLLARGITEEKDEQEGTNGCD